MNTDEFNEIKDIAIRFGKRMGRVPLGVYASSASFFMFTAIIPLVMLVSSILPFTSLTTSDVTSFIMHIAPDKIEDLIETIVDTAWQDANKAIIVVAVIVALWLASVAVLAIMRGLDAIYEVKKRNYFILRGIACLYTLVLMVICIVLMFVMMFGRTISRVLIHSLPASGFRPVLMTILRYAASAVLLLLLFLCCYSFIPSERQRFSDQVPGAVFTSVVWTITSVVFSLISSRPGAYSIYGSLAMTIITLVYVYVLVYILFIGAEINVFLVEERDEILRLQNDYKEKQRLKRQQRKQRRRLRRSGKDDVGK